MNKKDRVEDLSFRIERMKETIRVLKGAAPNELWSQDVLDAKVREYESHLLMWEEELATLELE